MVECDWIPPNIPNLGKHVEDMTKNSKFYIYCYDPVLNVHIFQLFIKQKTNDELKLFFFRSEASRNSFFCKCLLVCIVEHSKQLTS